MLKIENAVTPSPEQWRSVIMGARNPMNSWDRSDSEFEDHCLEDWPHDIVTTFENLGPNDLDLMKRLRNAGTDHRKFMRMITVYVDITGPLYWWKEMDTYQVGVVKNSCSTMHKIAAKEFSLEDFSHEHLMTYDEKLHCDCEIDHEATPDGFPVFKTPKSVLEITIRMLNEARRKYNDSSKKLKRTDLTDAERKHVKAQQKWYWWQMIQLLPSSYNQRRTVMLNYEVLANIYKSRRNHKLDEWRELCEWIEELPYSELITGKE